MISDFKTLITTIIGSVFKPLVGLLVALSLVYFLWGVFKYIQSVGDETKRKEGINMMTYGIIALFVIVSVWGLVRVLQSTFQFNPNPLPPPSTRSSMTNPLPGLG